MKIILSSWREPGRVAIEAARDRATQGGDLVDILEAGLAAAEMDPDLLMIGYGSLPNSEGELQLDASMMRGDDQLAGGVCALQGVLPAISVARKVMEATPHIQLAGQHAREFALRNGFEARQTLSPLALKKYEDWRKDPKRVRVYEHAASDTVTMLGWEDGRTVAASSTSGLPYKMPGRVGDSPIFGAGIYADDEVGAAGSTGDGEELWKACASFRTLEFMRHGDDPLTACEKTIRHMLRRQPKAGDLPCVVFAISQEGEYGAACSNGDFELWICRDGELTMTVYPELAR